MGETWSSEGQKTQRRREWSTKADIVEQSCKVGMEENTHHVAIRKLVTSQSSSH